MRGSADQLLRLGHDYFEGAAYGSGGADGLALGAPVALRGLYNGNNFINQHQTMLQADVNTQPAAVALFKLYLWFFQHILPNNN
jgi:hypothetical protein